MPIVHFHLADTVSPEATERLLVAASHLYAEVLACPVDRIRAYAALYPPARVAVGGVVAPAHPAPYFHFVVLEGRPVEQRHRLLEGFTTLLVDLLGVPAALVRGACLPVHPENWSIGGTPASEARAAEIAARRPT